MVKFVAKVLDRFVLVRSSVTVAAHVLPATLIVADRTVRLLVPVHEIVAVVVEMYETVRVRLVCVKDSVAATEVGPANLYVEDEVLLVDEVVVKREVKKDVTVNEDRPMLEPVLE